jgi:hypothetical protein
MSSKGIYVNSSSGTLLNANETRYISIPDAPFRSATEADKSVPFKAYGGTFSKMSLYVSANTLSVNGTYTFRFASGDGTQTFTVTAGVTGLFQDTTHSDTITANDVCCYKWVAPAGSGAATVTMSSMAFSPSTNYRVYVNASGGTLSNASNYKAIQGNSGSATEALTQVKFRTGGVLKNARVYVTANSSTTNVAVKSRINGANGNINVTVTALTTGEFVDNTNTDTIASTDLVNWDTSGATTGNPSGGTMKVEFVPTDSYLNQLSGSASNSVTSGTTAYLAPACSFGSASTVAEARLQAPVDFDYTISKAEVYVSANATSSNSTFDLRVNGVSSAITMTITAGVTGYFSDLSNTVSGNSGDLINFRCVNGGGGTLTMNGFNNLMQETQSTPASTSKRLSLLGVG